MVCWIVCFEKIAVIWHVNSRSKAFKKTIEQHQESLLELNFSQLGLSDTPLFLHPYVSIYVNLKKKAVEMLDKNRFFLSFNNENSPAYLTPADLSLLESYVATVISFNHKKLEKNLFVLSTIVTLAPFMGLLGTVWGILVTFSGLQQGGVGVSNTLVLGGISTALATTVMGLIIAIPALVSYNYLKNSITHYASDMDDFLSELLSHIELRYRKVESEK